MAIINSKGVLAQSANYVGAYTWATRPAANSVAIGTEITVTDVGPQHNRFVSDGTYWRPVGMVPLLSQLTTITKTDADTAGQVVFSYTIPAGLMAPGTAVRSSSIRWRTNAVVAVNKFLAFTLAGTGLGTFLMSPAQQSLRQDFEMIAVNATTIETWWPGTDVSYGGQTGAAIATNTGTDLVTNANALVATANWDTAGSGTNTLSVQPLKLWLVP